MPFCLINVADCAKFIKSVERLAKKKPEPRDSIFNEAISALKAKSVIWNEGLKASDEVLLQS